MSAATTYRNVTIEGSNIFYREAGDPTNPTLVLLGGYPSSSAMFRTLIDDLSDQFHLIAPDYPGFGHSSVPSVDKFAYTFDHIADVMDQFLESLSLSRYTLYIQDYGGPVGLRIAARHPDRVQSLIVQNANAYDEGFTAAWNLFRALWSDRNPDTEAAVASIFKPEITRFFYAEGARDLTNLNPDAWNLDQYFLDRPGSHEAQMELFYDYRNNPPQYPAWHEYFRLHQPRTLVVWGKGDPFFGPAGATAYQRDLPDAEIHLLNTGHFSLEEEGDQIAGLIREFLLR